MEKDFIDVPSFGPSSRGRGRGRGYMRRGGGSGGNKNNNHNNWGRGRGGNPSRGGRGGSGRSGGGRAGGCRGPPNFELDWRDPIDEMGTRSSTSLSIAVQGCCHGELDAIYDRLEQHAQRSQTPLPDVLLCCGDFQSLRNTADFHSLAVPPKYRNMGSFWKYYAGLKVAPVLTIFIGGNHEASQALHELYYGGWVAPNIFYLGAAGVVRLGGLRIAGLSGIYKSHDYTQGRYELPPYDRSTMRSVYHLRNIDAYRMRSCTPSSLDVMLSHDWPQGIEQHGDAANLIRNKPFFRKEVERNELGSPSHWEILQTLQPRWWFSAHLHVKFQAQVRHGKVSGNKEEESSITLLVPSQVVTQSSPSQSNKFEEAKTTKENTQEDAKEDPTETAGKHDDISTTQFVSLEPAKVCGDMDDLTDQMTRFLSLDKCLPRRQYLSLVHIPAKTEKRTLEYDAEWLYILKKTHHLTVAERRRVIVPSELLPPPSDQDLDWIYKQFGPSLEIDPNDFCVTVPPYLPNEPMRPPILCMGNPQTDKLLQKLEVDHIITVPYQPTPTISVEPAPDENEIDLDEMDGGEAQDAVKDENEIILDDDDDMDNDVAKDHNEIELDDIDEESASKKPRVDA